MDNKDNEGSSLNFQLHDNLIGEILAFFDNKLSINDDRVTRFVCSLYTFLPDMNPKYIKSFVSKIE